MPGIVITFNKKNNDEILNLYKSINLKFNQNLLNLDSIPHISLMRIQKNFSKDDIDIIKLNLKSLSIKKFDIHIDSIGIFKKNNKSYVLYFKPKYDNNLRNLHTKIWNKLNKKVELLQENLYSPDNFSPHITIPINNPNKTNLFKICNHLLTYNIEYNFITKDISFINTEKNSKKIKIYFSKKFI